MLGALEKELLRVLEEGSHTVESAAGSLTKSTKSVWRSLESLRHKGLVTRERERESSTRWVYVYSKPIQPEIVDDIEDAVFEEIKEV